MSKKEEILIHKMLTTYINKIDSLKHSLPILLRSSKEELRKEAKELSDFINTISTKNENGKHIIEIKYIRQLNRKKKNMSHMSTVLDLLPKNFLISYVAQYDSFLGDFTKAMLLQKPELMNDSERELKFKDIMEFETINDAREFILEKEIESLLRKSHIEQFKWLEKKFSIPLTKNLDIWKYFIEITERRNLFVHNNGKVSNQYIKVCKEVGIDVSKIRTGDTLNVETKYILEAHAIFYELVFKLVNVLWRKLLPEELEKADTSLIDLTYELLATKNYKLVIKLLDFACETIKKYNSDINRRMLIINRAMAYKYSNHNEKCLSLLKRDDWSATGLNFQLAIAILKDKDEEAYKIMKQLGKDHESISEDVYLEWPLFEKIRIKDEFKKTYEEIFDNKLEIIEEIKNNK